MLPVYSGREGSITVQTHGLCGSRYSEKKGQLLQMQSLRGPGTASMPPANLTQSLHRPQLRTPPRLNRPPEFRMNRPPEFCMDRPPEFCMNRPPGFRMNRPPELRMNRPPESRINFPPEPSPGIPHEPSPGIPHEPSPGILHDPSPGIPHEPSPGIPNEPWNTNGSNCSCSNCNSSSYKHHRPSAAAALVWDQHQKSCRLHAGATRAVDHAR